MAKSTLKREGVLTIRFQSPAPADLGRSLRAELEQVLDPRDEFSASKRGQVGDRPGWVGEIRVKKIRELDAAAERVLGVLRTNGVEPGTPVERWERRGPLKIEPLAETPSLDPLRFPGEPGAWAEAFIELPGMPDRHAAFIAALTERVGGLGAVTHQVKFDHRTVATVRIDDAEQLPSAIDSLRAMLREWAPAEKIRLDVCSESPRTVLRV